MVSEVKNHNKINKEQFSQDYLTNIQQFLNQENKNELLKYIKENNHASPRMTFVTKDGFRLGGWINNQRNAYRYI